MRFWDTSAILPLLVTEKESVLCRRLLEDDPEMLVWVLTPTEIYSACYRKVREGMLGEDVISDVRSRLMVLETCWSTVVSFEVVQAIATRLLAVHPLRAADALQLAAALVAFEERPIGAEFVSLDARLNHAAQREGFQILPDDPANRSASPCACK
ncbi:MAG: type II toxin-antitoxin system VapC family toxin [Deltaproteobacteria bacterium]|nr:type II toxin-antitoxin system VapC family toxin [Deltaproteobacteria bacterium]